LFGSPAPSAQCPLVQSPSAEHGTQVCVDVLHTGVLPLHCALDEQATHLFWVVSQAGLAPVQAVASAAVHSTHCPALVPCVSHAGVAPVQSLGVQARQVSRVESPLPTSQIGLAPAHLLLSRHATQCPFFGSSAPSAQIDLPGVLQSVFCVHRAQAGGLAPSSQTGLPGLFETMH
jgi:hypothetical protein